MSRRLSDLDFPADPSTFLASNYPTVSCQVRQGSKAGINPLPSQAPPGKSWETLAHLLLSRLAGRFSDGPGGSIHTGVARLIGAVPGSESVPASGRLGRFRLLSAQGRSARQLDYKYTVD